MQFPIVIELGGTDHAFGVAVPDLPGCFAAGTTLDEAIRNARRAIELWIEEVVAKGGAAPLPTATFPERLALQTQGVMWTVVKVEVGVLLGNKDYLKRGC